MSPVHLHICGHSKNPTHPKNLKTPKPKSFCKTSAGSSGVDLPLRPPIMEDRQPGTPARFRIYGLGSRKLGGFPKLGVTFFAGGPLTRIICRGLY